MRGLGPIQGTDLRFGIENAIIWTLSLPLSTKGKARPHAECWHLHICETINCLDNLFSLALTKELGIERPQWSESQGMGVVTIQRMTKLKAFVAERDIREPLIQRFVSPFKYQD